MNYATVPLAPSFKKDYFSCGKQVLDDYLHFQASQDIRRKLSTVFVLPDENMIIKGYYTLSNGSIDRDNVPESILKRLPTAYSKVPTTLLGRLAVDRNFIKQGLGELLLLDALKRSYVVSKMSIGSIAVIVDPLDEEAKSFYRKYQFIEIPDTGKMFLPMKLIEHFF